MARAGALHAIGSILAASMEEEDGEEGYQDFCSECEGDEACDSRSCHSGPRWLQVGAGWDWERKDAGLAQKKEEEPSSSSSLKHRHLLIPLFRLPDCGSSNVRELGTEICEDMEIMVFGDEEKENKDWFARCVCVCVYCIGYLYPSMLAYLLVRVLGAGA